MVNFKFLNTCEKNLNKMIKNLSILDRLFIRKKREYNKTSKKSNRI